MSFAGLVNLNQSVLFIKMKLSAWYPLLQQHTAQTILIDLSLPTKQRNEQIEKSIAILGPVFVRVDELSPTLSALLDSATSLELLESESHQGLPRMVSLSMLEKMGGFR